MQKTRIDDRSFEARGGEPRKTDLTPSRRRLVELMQEIQYGEIHGLWIAEGDPVLDPMPEIYRDVIPGRDNGPHSARAQEDFVLKREVVDLFDIFDHEKNVQIARLVIQTGLPLRARLRVSSKTE